MKPKIKTYVNVFSNTELSFKWSGYSKSTIRDFKTNKKVKVRVLIRKINQEFIRNGIGNHSIRLKNALSERGKLIDLRLEANKILAESYDKQNTIL